MSRLAKNIGHLETVTVTYPTPTETYNPSGVMLPVSEPASSQISYTIQSSDLASFSNPSMSCTWAAVVIVAGRNNAATMKNVYYRILKNGSSIASAYYYISSAYYYTFSFMNFVNVTVGDTLETRLWCTNGGGTDVDWRYSTYFIRPTRFVFGDTKDIYFDFTCSEFYTMSFSSGPNPKSYGSGESGNPSLYYHPSDSSSTCSIGSSQKLFAIMHNPTFGLGRVNYGDYSWSTTANTSSTNMPYYDLYNRHTKFQFRRMKL